MPGKEENDTLEKSLKELNLTSDEMTKFEKAFKDPEFIKLFEEYAKEVSDPKVKAETDAYLRQIEQQGRAEDVYGAGTQLIVPDPAGAVIKTKVVSSSASKKQQQEQEKQEKEQQQQAAGAGKPEGPGKQGALPVGQKVFINICTCDKLERYSLTDAQDPATGRLRPKLTIPLSLGPVRQGADKQGAPAAVYDFVVHPDSWTFAAGNAAGLATLADTALDHVEQVGRCRLVRAWKRLNCRYKGTEGAAEPPVQCIRTSAAAAAGAAGEGAGGRVRPRPDVPGVPDLPGAKTAPPAAAGAAATAAAAAGAAEGGAGSSSRSTFSFDKSRKAGGTEAAGAVAKQEATITDPARPGYRHPDGAVTPEWGLLHRGEADLGEAWGDAGKGLAAGGRVPKELVVRVTLPDVSSAAPVDLDVGARCLALTVPNRYRLSVQLPYGVDDAKGRAKFDKARKVLEVTLPVVPPPAPPPGAAAAARAGLALIQELGGSEEAAEVKAEVEVEVADVMGRDQEAAHAKSEAGAGAGVKSPHTAAAASSGAAPAPAAASEEEEEEDKEDGGPAAGSGGDPAAAAAAAGASSGRELTENERKWRELHARQQQEEQEQQEAAEAAAAAAAAAAEPSSRSQLTGTVAQGGAAAAAESVAAAKQQVQQQPVAAAAAPTAVLRPRLNRELAMELD
uniref:Protein kintoun n=1 Tax=Chlamydomonas reinhardtii TaxID=3055 RepID=KTU_CHLRE|nr:RecName: Full=Protein kintoun; AltName: Full=Dynein assembly factor 2, axonemal homolog; AltName: Full=Paralyzed flagella protein 13 [Chlamydomonas reinhardtii]BAG69288.1 PF13 [Chlamydomonas reinhardtii]